MKCRVFLLVGIMVMGLFATYVSAEQNKSKAISVSVSSDDILLDGTPSEFDIKQFTSKLNKVLLAKLDDKSLRIDNDKFDYLLKVDIESMKHKFLPFQFGVSYIIDYKYKLLNTEKKELLRQKSNGRNFDQFDLIDEVTNEIVKNVLVEINK
ncbi:MAG: hypothetical protein FD174_3104 [Geobacteraceae bacterium]|nr:MAG: hypothetical protein FD174_3104 [Geobacteraceae bacterium]